MTAEPSDLSLVVPDFGSDAPGATKTISGPMAIALQNMRPKAAVAPMCNSAVSLAPRRVLIGPT